MVRGGGGVLQDGVIHDDRLLGFRSAVLCCDGARVVRKAGRRVAYVPTDSVATTAAVVRSRLQLCCQCLPATRAGAVKDACALGHAHANTKVW